MARAWMLAASFAVMIASGAADAQTWPSKPVTFVVSQAAGSSPDVMARLVAGKLEKIIGQGVVIDNKPGGGNVIGAQAAARAAPDGYTYFFATSASLANNPFMMKRLPYDPVKDFAPVGLVTRSNQLIVAHKDVPVKTLGELIAYDKKEPGKLSLAVDGPRALAGVTAQALNYRAGTKFVLVPYPNINAGIQDVITGRVGVGIFSISIIETHARAGSVTALAIASAKRASALPDIPAATETIPNFDFSGWFMLMAPAGAPAPILARMNAALAEAVKDPQVREMAPKLGYELDPAGIGSPGDAAAFLAAQLAYWEKTTKELGIEPE